MSVVSETRNPEASLLGLSYLILLPKRLGNLCQTIVP